MDVGFALPQFGKHAEEAVRVTWFATELEKLGAHSLWVGDRLMAPANPVVGYGGTDSIPPEFRRVLDPFVLMTLASAATSTVKIGSSVLNMPWYPPIFLARSLTTIDVVSGGRLIPGFGLGWSPDEYAGANIPWPARGARLEESLDDLEAVWGESPVAYDGATWTLPLSHVDLKPTQQPRPPIYLGGTSEAALRRVGRRADGWMPAGRLPMAFSPEMFLGQRKIIQRGADEVGRDITGLPTALRVNVPAGTQLPDIAKAMNSVSQATGIDHFFVDFMYVMNDLEDGLDMASKLLALL